MNTIIKIVLCCLVGYSPLFGQSFEQDMNRMQSAYDNVDDLYIEMENSVWRESSVITEQKAIIRKKGEHYFYDVGEAMMLISGKHILMIDNISKTIVHDTWTKEKASQLTKQHIVGTNDILKKYASVSYKGETNKRKKYVLENEKEQMSKVEVSFESKTGFMREIKYYYNPKLTDAEVYTRLKLEVIDVNPSFDSSVFSEKQFITEEGGKIKGVGKYSDYKIQSAQ